MDADAIRSFSEDQMDMMLMMLQMEKMPEFSDVQAETSELMGAAGNLNMSFPASSSPLPASYMNPGSYPACMLPSGGGGIHDEARSPAGESDGDHVGATRGKKNSLGSMREMIFRIAAMQPIHIDPESVKPPKRRNVKISKDPQSVAARHRRERISERIRILQRLVPGGTKMDTASMLDEAIQYVKFLKTEVQSLEQAAAASQTASATMTTPMRFGGLPVAMAPENYSKVQRAYPSGHVLNARQLLGYNS